LGRNTNGNIFFLTKKIIFKRKTKSNIIKANKKVKERFMKNHIYMLRKKRGIKQYDMARALSVSPSYLSKIETDTQEPTAKFKTNAAKYLKTNVDKLFSEEPVEKVYPEFSSGLTNKLWAKRRELGIKQYDMAKKLKVSTPFLSKVELGLIEPPEDFKQLASKVFKMDKDELFLARVEY
jgi:putative transcriptional regulator